MPDILMLSFIWNAIQRHKKAVKDRNVLPNVLPEHTMFNFEILTIWLQQK
jgi:hypothetical protein